MVEVFTTNVQNLAQVKRVMHTLEAGFPGIKIDFDLNESEHLYPCGHSILRVEDTNIHSDKIISLVTESGFKCDILEDRVCEDVPSSKPEFWEANFIEKQEMWGFEPAHSALVTKDFFVEKSIKNILIPGIGYGRNAQIFRDAGMAVTGIEISKTAIELARKHFGPEMPIFHGSVADMPFDSCQYDGIFCHALIHLLDGDEREKLLQDCYNQLAENGYLVFTAISKEAPTYGKGKFISKDRYEVFEGVKLFFYDQESIENEFEKVGLIEIISVKENYPFFLIKCKKTV